MSDNPEPGTVLDVIIDEMTFPRGGGVVTGRVLFYMMPNEAERDGAEILVTTAIPWDRRGDLIDDARRALAKSARRLLRAAADLPDQELDRLLDAGLAEELLPHLHPGRQTH